MVKILNENITHIMIIRTTRITIRLSSDLLLFGVPRSQKLVYENWNQHMRSPRSHITQNDLLLSSIIFAFVLPDTTLCLATFRGNDWLLCQSSPTPNFKPCTFSCVLYNIGSNRREQLFHGSGVARLFGTQVK